MNITSDQFLSMLERCDAARGKSKREPAGESDSKNAVSEPESAIRKRILDFCGSQWPVWIVLAARTDERSTLPEGAHDLTIFGPFPLCICVETKGRGGKLRATQQIWIKKLEMLGWKVWIVKTWEQFQTAVDESKAQSK